MKKKSKKVVKSNKPKKVWVIGDLDRDNIEGGYSISNMETYSSREKAFEAWQSECDQVVMEINILQAFGEPESTPTPQPLNLSDFKL